jgi:hypothetical protein
MDPKPFLTTVRPTNSAEASAAVAGHPQGLTEPARSEHSAPRKMPEPFTFAPFAFDSCTIECTPTAAEQAAYSAHYRKCRSAEDFWDGATAADWMLDILGKHPDVRPATLERELRTFALRCTEGLQGAASPSVQALLEVVRRRLSESATLEDLSAAQVAAHPHVAQGGIQGLPRCMTYAAALLAAWHAAARDPGQAAFWGSEFAARHDAFVVLERHASTWHWPEDGGEQWRESWRTAFFAKAHLEVEAAALADARRRQADLLRSILPKPFGARIRGEVYFGPAPDTDRERVYCMTCGFQRDDTTPGVIFDVRGVQCASCGAPVARCVH